MSRPDRVLQMTSLFTSPHSRASYRFLQDRKSYQHLPSSRWVPCPLCKLITTLIYVDLPTLEMLSSSFGFFTPNAEWLIDRRRGLWCQFIHSLSRPIPDPKLSLHKNHNLMGAHTFGDSHLQCTSAFSNRCTLDLISSNCYCKASMVDHTR